MIHSSVRAVRAHRERISAITQTRNALVSRRREDENHCKEKTNADTSQRVQIVARREMRKWNWKK
jgi:hypothetical protein